MSFLYEERKLSRLEMLLFLPFVVFLGFTIYYKLQAFIYNKTWENDLNLEILTDFIDFYGEFILIPLVLFVTLLPRDLYLIDKYLTHILYHRILHQDFCMSY